ncbi:hypothetical protein DL769_003910 [Monosporascus sp. CRB-8-3]|nr:hypothetical protein DL769_003910 [Monosporascus sp. CRB-8-3]
MASRSRTQKVPESAWLQHKDNIVDLYLREDLTVGRLAERMRADHGLNATISQYEAQLKVWNVRKNLKVHEWEPILERIGRLPTATRSRVILSGQPVPEHRIQRARRHSKSRSAKRRRLEDRLEYTESPDVYIEIQRVDGTWSKLEETEALLATTASPQPRFENAVESAALLLSERYTDNGRLQQDREVNGLAMRYDFDSWFNSPRSPIYSTLPDLNISMDQSGFSQFDDMAQSGSWETSLFGLQREKEWHARTTPSFSPLLRARSIPQGPKAPTLYLPPQWFEELSSTIFVDEIASKVLSASIRGNSSDLIDLILEQNPNVAGDAHNIDTQRKYEKALLTTPLAEAILIKNLPLIRRLEEAGALQCLDQGEQFDVALASAAKVGDTEYMRKLLALCPRARPSAVALALSYAVENNQTDIALELLDIDADPFMLIERDYSEALIAAIKNRNARLVRAILNSDVLNNWSSGASGEATIEAALQWGDQSIIRDLLAACPLVEFPSSLYVEALEYEDRNAFESLLALRKPSGRNLSDCLKIAIEKDDSSLGHTKDLGFPIINRLLDHGCDANSIVRYNEICFQTAILTAIEVGDKELVQFFIDRGADVHQAPNFSVKRSPLQRAAELGNLGIVKLLLKNEVDVNGAPAVRGGGTAVQLAAISGNCNVVAELLSHGALLHIPPSKVNGRWPIEGAAEHGRLTMIEFLWKVNENIFYPDPCETGFEEKHCRRAMELAAENGHMVCRDLIAELSGLPVMDA